MQIDDESFNLFFPHCYHLTSKSKIDKIRELGLIPMCGENSKSIQDYIEAVYFFLNLHRIPDWVSLLLHGNYDEAVLIKFDTRYIKNIYVNDIFMGDCYTLDKINSEHLYILDGNVTPKIYEQKELIWKPLKND